MVSEYINFQEGNLSKTVPLKSAQPGLYLLSVLTSKAELLEQTAPFTTTGSPPPPWKGLGKPLHLENSLYFPLTPSLKVT